MIDLLSPWLFLTLLRASFRDPAKLIRHLRALEIEQPDMWTLLSLMVVLSTIMISLPLAIVFQHMGQWPVPIPGPLALFIMSLAMTAFLAVAIYGFGAMLGGRASFEGTLAVVTWIQVVQVALQLVGLVISIILPFLGMFYTLLATGTLIWLWYSLAGAVHGFDNKFKSVLVLMMSFAALIFLGGLYMFYSGAGMFPAVDVQFPQ